LLTIILIFVGVISPALAAIFVGVWSKKHLPNSDPVNSEMVVDLKAATIGVVLMTLLSFVPIIGDIVKIIFFMVAFGSIMRYIRLSIIK
jgi:hypothetical protein